MIEVLGAACRVKIPSLFSLTLTQTHSLGHALLGVI